MILDRKSILAGCALVLAIFGAAPSFSQQDRDSTEQKAAESPEQRSLKAFLATIKEAKAGDDLTSTVAGIEAMAREGDPVASVAAGDLYRDGKLVPKDIAKAIDLYTKALERGRLAAAAKLGDLYRQGEALGLDPSKAVGYYEQGLKAGDAGAKAGMAALYAEGVLVGRDIPKAVALYEEIIAAGGTWAASSLAALYLKGDEVGLDPAKAVGYYQQGVQAGDAGAMIGLANIYRDGKLVPKDIAKAIDLYTKALEKGRLGAAAKLGDLYRQGQSAGLDPSKAVGYYEQGLKAGDAGAKAGMAALYAEGLLVGRDIPKAVALYEEIIAAGGTWAVSSLAALYLKGDEFGLDPAKAVGYYQQGVQAGDAGAMAGLASLYRDGLVLPRDVSKAADLYQDAYRAGRKSGLASAASALLGGTQSQQRQAHDLILKGQAEGAPGISSVLANAVLGGVGVPKNPERAIEILRKASVAGDANAASTLVQLYAQGRGKDVAKNISLARTTLASFASLMPQDQRQGEELFVEGAAAGSVGQYAAFAEKIAGLAQAARVNLVGRLVSANGNAYVYILQSELKRTGDYKDKLNGVLTAATIRAFNEMCERRDKAARCRLGPLSKPARDVFLDFLREANS